MKIKQIKNEQVNVGNIVRVGAFSLKGKELIFKKSNLLSWEEYISDFGRVYFFTIETSIYKIGGSASKGGIKNTIDSYLNGNRGQPGESRFIGNALIADEVKKKKKVEVYMILCPETYVRINGLTTKGLIVAVNPFKEIESLCMNDFYSNEKKYPKWNFKENGESYPIQLKKKYSQYKTQALKAK